MSLDPSPGRNQASDSSKVLRSSTLDYYSHYIIRPETVLESNRKSTRTVRHANYVELSSTTQFFFVYLECQPQPLDQYELTLPPWETLLHLALEVARTMVFEM